MPLPGVVAVAGLELLQEADHSSATELAPEGGEAFAANLIKG
jgi:hypothetical protein